MKCLYILTEEQSIKIVFETIIPKFFPGIIFKINPHQGKEDLKKALTSTVPTLSKNPETSILVVIDQDNDDCKILKAELISILNKTCQSKYLVRIVCTMLESWFLGDLNAIAKGYNRVKPEHHIHKQMFQNVDTIKNPSQKLLSIIPDYSNRQRLPKIEIAERIAPHMSQINNRSKSFKQFIIGIEKLIKDE